MIHMYSYQLQIHFNKLSSRYVQLLQRKRTIITQWTIVHTAQGKVIITFHYHITVQKKKNAQYIYAYTSMNITQNTLAHKTRHFPGEHSLFRSQYAVTPDCHHDYFLLLWHSSFYGHDTPGFLFVCFLDELPM